MRLRLVVPRRRRGRGLGGLAAVAAGLIALAAAGALGLLVGRSDDQPSPPPGAPGLAIGITEPNPSFLRAGDGVPEPFARWRDALASVRPAYYRLVLDWARLQSSPDRPADLELRAGGCMRDVPPCAGWDGVRAQLRALAERQRDGGWEGVAVITGTPAWAAAHAAGCEPDGPAEPRSRPPRGDALPAYRQLVADVLALAEREGARLRYWSAWNEPNHPYFLSSQRAACDGPSVAPARYAELVESLRAALGEGHEVVLGELAAITVARGDTTPVDEFIAGLPRTLVCSSPIWAQHAYGGGRTDIVDVAARALDAHRCERRHAIWATETGLRLGPRELENSLELGAEAAEVGPAAACRVVHDQLLRFHADPRVTVAFQYTLREDDRFRSGLVTTALDRAYPVLGLWQAWGGEARPSPDDPPPPRAAACP